MGFSSLLLVNIFSLVLGYFGESSYGQQIKARQNYDCICPSFKREVCSYGPSGSIITYPNLCAAKCTVTRDRNQKIDILPRSACKSMGVTPQSLAGETMSRNFNWTTDEWIKDISRESRIWKRVNRLMVRLVEHSTGGGSEAPPCLCPGIERPTCDFGPSGNIINYENMCAMSCAAFQKNSNGVRVGPNNCNGTITESSTVSPAASEDEGKELKEWTSFMEHEIRFYRKVDQAMNDLFIKAQARV